MVLHPNSIKAFFSMNIFYMMVEALAYKVQSGALTFRQTLSLHHWGGSRLEQKPQCQFRNESGSALYELL